MTRNMIKVHVLTLAYLLYFRAMATCDHHVGWCVIIVLAQFQIQGGIPVWGDDCAYEFSSILNQTGRLFSPKYPQHYPPLAHCRYTFIGMGERTRVKVVFTSIALASSDRRYAAPQSQQYKVLLKKWQKRTSVELYVHVHVYLEKLTDTSYIVIIFRIFRVFVQFSAGQSTCRQMQR